MQQDFKVSDENDETPSKTNVKVGIVRLIILLVCILFNIVFFYMGIKFYIAYLLLYFAAIAIILKWKC